MLVALRPLSAQYMSKLFSRIIPPANYDIKMTFINFHDTLCTKLGIRLPTQLKLLISSAIASGLLGRGTDGIRR
jgi:hypothetical protein